MKTFENKIKLYNSVEIKVNTVYKTYEINVHLENPKPILLTLINFKRLIHEKEST